MFYPILLSMIAATAGVVAQDPEPTIRVTLNNDGQYLPGDRSKVQVITRDDGYLLVFQVNPEGRLRVLFPLDPTDDNYVKGGKRYLLLGRGGREGFGVETAGTGVVFAAVSVDPWRTDGYVVFGHWDYAVFNGINFDDTEPQLVNLAQGMAGGRFDYDIVGYTVASQVAAAPQAAVAQDPAYVSGSVGVVDSCYNCASPVGVIYGTGYYNTSGLFDPFYYSPYYNYGPYYPAWSFYGPYYGAYYGYPTWNWGWGCYGYCNGNPFNPYNPYYYPQYPYYPGYPYYGYNSAVPYGGGTSPYQMKSGGRTWSGSPVPYRPRYDNGYTATNSVSGALPGIGVQQHASFRNRSFSGGSVLAGGSTVNPGAVPVSKGNSGVSTTGRRRDAAPAATPSRPAGGSTLGTTPPKAVPSRPRGQSPASSQRSATSTLTAPGEKAFLPEASRARTSAGAPRAVAAPMPSTGNSSFERRTLTPNRASSQPAAVPPVSRTAPAAAPAATKATVEGRSSEPVLRRREPDKPAASEAPARAPRPESQRDPSLGRSYGNEPSQPSGGAVSAPTGGWNGGGNTGGGGGRATSTPPSGNAGGGGRASSPPAPSGAVAGGGRRH